MDTQKIEALRDDTGAVMVEFYASWCPHCQRMMPVVEDLKALFEGRANIYQFDIDENAEFADSLDVRSIPTFIIYYNGEELWRTTGETEGNVLARKIEDAISHG